MKKLLSLLLVIMMFASCIPAFADATWTISDSGALKVNSDVKLSGEVVIPETVDGITVTSLDGFAFNNQNDVTSIVMPDTIQSMGGSSINFLNGLTSVKLSENLTVIDDMNFCAMKGLTSLTIPASVCFIGDSLTSLQNLQTLTFEGVCPMFGIDNALNGLNRNCVIYVPDDQVDAYKAALTNGYGTEEQVQPSGKNAVIYDNPAAESEFVFDAATGAITGYTGTSARLQIPATIGGAPVKAIAEKAFSHNAALCFVVIPEGVETIGNYAFDYCDNLVVVDFPSTLKKIGDSAFEGCYLSSVGWKEGLEEIGANAFARYGVQTLALPSTVKTIGEAAFKNGSIRKLYIGNQIESIGAEAFANNFLDRVELLTDRMIQIDETAFAGNTNDTYVYLRWNVPYDVYKDYEHLFLNIYEGITYLYIQAPIKDLSLGLEYPADGTDSYNQDVWVSYNGTQPNLMTWYSWNRIPITTLGDGLFKGNQTIKSWYCSHEFTMHHIGNEAFADSSVEFVDLYHEIYTIGEHAFRNCVNIKEITLPETLTSIAANAFEGCTGLEKITILCDPSILPVSLLDSCTALTEIVAPDMGAVEAALKGSPEVLSASASVDSASVNEAITFTVVTNDVAEYLTLFAENDYLVKTWPAEGNAVVSGEEKTWTVQYAFGSAGNRAIAFKASEDEVNFDAGKPLNIQVRNVAKVESVSASADTVSVGENIVFTAKTSENAQHLALFAENDNHVKTWAADGNAVNSEGGKVWTIEYAFGGAGDRSIAFKASVDGKEFSEAAPLNVKVLDKPVVVSVSASSDSVTVGENITFTVVTSVNAKYLALFAENDNHVKTWAADGITTVNGAEMTWTVDYAFGGAGNRAISFKAGANESDFSAPSPVSITVVKEESNTPFAITVQPYDAELPEGEMTNITVEATGDGLTYQWYVMPVSKSEFAPAEGFNTNVYSVPVDLDSDWSQVYCVITDAYGNSLTSETASIFIAESEVPAAPAGEVDPAMVGHWVTTKADLGGMVVEGADLEIFGMNMWVDLAADGTASMFMEGEEMSGISWSVADGMLWLTLGGDSMAMAIPGDGTLNMEGIIFEMDAAAAPAEPAAPVEAVPATPAAAAGDAADFVVGAWKAVSGESDGMTLDASMLEMFGLVITMEFNADGTGVLAMEGEEEGPFAWSIADGVLALEAEGEVMNAQLNADDTFTMDFGGAYVTFAKAEGNADETAGDEMSDEEMLAFLAMMAAAMEEEETGEVVETPVEEPAASGNDAYVGTWKACYLSTGAMVGDPRSMFGLTVTLQLNADGTGSIDFPEATSGIWYPGEYGFMYFGQGGDNADMPMSLLDGGYLKYGTDLAGYIVFSKDESAVWTPEMDTAASAPVVPEVPVVTPEPAPAAPAVSAGGAEERLNKKFVAKNYTAFGQVMDASMLGAEYSMFFREDGTCDFGLAGMVVPNLPWGMGKVAVGLNEVDAFIINYYGTMFNAVLTETGFDMDYYGTMNLHFVPAE